MDSETRLFGVIGSPIKHSLSPLMHNAAFSFSGLNAVYLAFDIKDPALIPETMRNLSIKGLSVTLPYKEVFLDLADKLDPLARRIGAVNTLCLKEDGSIFATNTDYLGARDALLSKTSLKDKRVAVLGAGGAARAVAYGVKEAGALPFIVNRGVDRGEALASELSASFCPLDDFKAKDTDIIVNTTSLGMYPHKDATPVKAEFLHPDILVMDIVYNPEKTLLLSQAEAAGCKTISGVEMFVRQGALQFELWTKKKAPLDTMRSRVKSALDNF